MLTCPRLVYHDLLVGTCNWVLGCERSRKKFRRTTKPSAQRFLQGAFQDADTFVDDLQ